MKTILDFIHESDCDNYIIYKNDNTKNVILSFYCGMNIVNTNQHIYDLSIKNIKASMIEKDIFDRNKNNLIIYLKEDVKT